MDLGKIRSILLEACILMVKRNYNNAEARALSHRLILLVLKSTNEHNVAEENVTGGESGTDSLDVVTAATTTPSGDVVIAGCITLNVCNAGSCNELLNCLVEVAKRLVVIGIVVIPVVSALVPLLLDYNNRGGVEYTGSCKTAGAQSKSNLLITDPALSGSAVTVVLLYSVGVIHHKVVGPFALPYLCIEVVDGKLAVTVKVAGDVLTVLLKKVDTNGDNEECTDHIGKVVRRKNVHLVLRKSYRVHPVVHITAVVNGLIVICIVELEVVKACKRTGTAGGTLKVCKIALNRRTNDIVNEVNVYVGSVLCGLRVNDLLDLLDTLTEAVGCGVVPVEILNLDLGCDLCTGVSLVDTGIDSLGVVRVVTCKVSVAS